MKPQKIAIDAQNFGQIGEISPNLITLEIDSECVLNEVHENVNVSEK